MLSSVFFRLGRHQQLTTTIAGKRSLGYRAIHVPLRRFAAESAKKNNLGIYIAPLFRVTMDK
jgi:hypothetical protein